MFAPNNRSRGPPLNITAYFTLHDVEGASFRNQLIEDVHVVQLAVADMDKTGDVAAQIE